MVTNEYSVKRTVIIKQAPALKTKRGAGDDPLYNKYKIGSTLTGAQCITEEQKRKLLPGIINKSPQSHEWDGAVNDYFNNISKTVEFEGLDLEVGLTYDDADAYEKKDAKRATPINVPDWILWRFLLVYNDCANTFDDLIPDRHRFYIDDKGAAVEREAKKAKVRTTAKKHFVQLILDDVKLTNVLLMLGLHEPESLDDNEKLLELERLSELDINKFVAICEDKNLNVKSFIYMCLNAGVLKTQPNTDVIYYENDVDTIQLGMTLDEAVSYLRRSENNMVYTRLRNSLEVVFRNKGKKYEFDILMNKKETVKDNTLDKAVVDAGGVDLFNTGASLDDLDKDADKVSEAKLEDKAPVKKEEETFDLNG